MAGEVIISLPAREWQRVVQLGTERRIRELEEQLAKVEQQILAFEEKYGATFEHFQEIGLPSNADWSAHEEYIEWSSWENCRTELRERLAMLHALAQSYHVTESP